MRKKGFTLIELLVVIAIIAVLMGILLPALSKVREQAKQKSCATRVRQHVLATTMYADENKGNLPCPTTSGSWLQDLAITTVMFMLKTGLTREMFYCPSNENHQKYNDFFWEFNNNSWDGRKFTNYTSGSFVCSGYMYILELTASAGKRPTIVAYRTDTDKKIWLKTNREKMPSLREVVVDSVMGVRQAGKNYGRNFAEVPGGIYSAHQVYDDSSHLRGRMEPIGGNCGFLDGHVEWRRFNPELASGVAVPRYGDAPGFFW